MSNSNFSWTNDMIFQLIDLVREKPELWDTSSVCFHDKEKKRTSWLEIANAINTDVDKIQRKTKMLMSHFRHCSRQCKKSGRKCRWFAFQKMSFLEPRPQRLQSEPTVESEEGGSATYFISMSASQINEHRSEIIVKEDLQRKKHLIVKDVVGNYNESRRKETKKLQPDNFIQEVESAEIQGKDEYTTYGELVAMKLRNLGNGYVRSTVQYHINNILYKAEIGEFDKLKRPRGENSFQRDDSTIDNDNSSVASILEDYVFKLENEDSDD